MRFILSSLALLASVSAFRVAKVEPRLVKVKEGESFRVVCTTDTWYEFCRIKHDDKICDIVWKWDAWNVTMGQCYHFSGRAVFAVSLSDINVGNDSVLFCAGKLQQLRVRAGDHRGSG